MATLFSDSHASYSHMHLTSLFTPVAAGTPRAGNTLRSLTLENVSLYLIGITKENGKVPHQKYKFSSVRILNKSLKSTYLLMCLSVVVTACIFLVVFCGFRLCGIRKIRNQEMALPYIFTRRKTS